MDIDINQSIQEIHKMISEVYVFMKDMKHDYDAIVGSIEMDRQTIGRLLGVSESTLYRWRSAPNFTLPCHYHSDRSTYYVYDEVYIALKRGQLRAKGFDRIEAMQRMKMYKEGVIRGLLSKDFADPEMV
ncbi:DNA-binding protein [Bacteroides sp. OttesenSCG-928-E20]|nr:DNA-binding protein [Bacteroides sp. OttesenSCG-928-N06]MDL2299989.1 DNA-binding protein [Bacteroides sp. OttesenSCG-928-E20]